MAKAKFNLLEGPVSGHINRMLGPFTLAVMALLSAGIVDTIYLGRVGTDVLAAMGFVFPISFTVNSCNIGLGAGTMSALSRAIGRKDVEQAKRHGAAAILLGVTLLTALTLVMVLSLDFVLSLMGAKPHIAALAKSYLVIALPGLIIVSIASMCNNILRANGEAALPSAIMIIGALLNIIIDPFLIFGLGPFPRMEIQGAAIATIIGNTVGMLFGVYLVLIRRKVVSFSGLTLAGILRAWKIIGRVGLPAAATNMIVPVAAGLATAIIARYLGTVTIDGDNLEVAAFNIALRAETIALGLLYALSACIGAVTGQNGGAGRTDRVRATFLYCYKICIAWGLLMGAVFFFLDEQIARMFVKYDPSTMTPDELADAAKVIALAKPYFQIVPITIIGYGAVFVTAAGFNSLGRPSYGLIFTILRSLGLYVPLVWVGVQTGGMIGAFVGIAIANILSGIVAVSWGLSRAPMTAKSH